MNYKINFVIFLFLVACFSAKCQMSKAKGYYLDTIQQYFLMEKDSRLNSENDAILRPLSLINEPIKGNLKKAYEKGLFLFGDSLSLGNYKYDIIKHGYQIMGFIRFKHLLDSLFLENKIVEVGGFNFVYLKLTVVLGNLGKKAMPVIFKRNLIKKIKIPLYYIIDIL